MKTQILTAIAMLLIIASAAGCASSKPIPDAAQLQAPSSTAEQPLLQELHEAETESKTADSPTEEKPEETPEKEMMISASNGAGSDRACPGIRTYGYTGIYCGVCADSADRVSLPADRACKAHRAGTGIHQPTAVYGTTKACGACTNRTFSHGTSPNRTDSHRTPANRTCGVCP